MELSPTDLPLLRRQKVACEEPSSAATEHQEILPTTHNTVGKGVPPHLAGELTEDTD